MAKNNYTTTIAIDAMRSVFHFYTALNGDKQNVTHYVKSYGGTLFDDDFMDKFRAAVMDFVMENPAEGIRKVSVIIPDCAVLTDAVKIPTLSGFGQTKKALDDTLDGLFLNHADLRVIAKQAATNKQYATYAITAVQKRIASAVYAACSENKLLVDTLTFTSNAAAGGAAVLNPKLKNASYLLLDIKDIYSRFVFVAGGKTVGFYSLPFGLEFLRKPQVTQEDMLFDHSVAELAVINAREKAKSKKLTVMAASEDEAIYDDQTDEAEEGVVAEQAEPTEQPLVDEPLADEQVSAEGDQIPDYLQVQQPWSAEQQPVAAVRPQPTPKLFIRKGPRKLPKFMQRDIPETPEGILYENFRVFEKWALTLIAGNEKLTDLGEPQFVCVNLPDDLVSVLDTVNESAEENGISFVALPHGNAAAEVTDNLELYGGLYPKQINAAGKL